MPIGRMEATRYPGVYRRKDGRLIVRVTTRVNGGWAQKTELQGPDVNLERARRRAEVLRDRVHEDADVLRSGQKPAVPVRPAVVETFGEYVIRWRTAKEQRMKPGPRLRYGHFLTARNLKVLWDIRVTEVSRSSVDSWVAGVERRRLSNGQPFATTTLQGWWRILSQVLKDVSADYDLPDPTRRVRPPEIGRASCRERV